MNKAELSVCNLNSVSYSIHVTMQTAFQVNELFFSPKPWFIQWTGLTMVSVKQSCVPKQAIADAISLADNTELGMGWRTSMEDSSSIRLVPFYFQLSHPSHSSDLFFLSSCQFCSPSAPNSFFSNSVKAWQILSRVSWVIEGKMPFRW